MCNPYQTIVYPIEMYRYPSEEDYIPEVSMTDDTRVRIILSKMAHSCSRSDNDIFIQKTYTIDI